MQCKGRRGAGEEERRRDEGTGEGVIEIVSDVGGKRPSHSEWCHRTRTRAEEEVQCKGDRWLVVGGGRRKPTSHKLCPIGLK
jgi:hypothetical protein